MSRTKIAAVGCAAMLAVALLPGVSSAAPATSVLTYGAFTPPVPPIPPVTPGDVLTAPLSTDALPATFYVPGTTTGTRCGVSNLTDQVLGNPAAPGVAVTRLVNLTFNSCASSIPGVAGVVSVVVSGLPFQQTFSDAFGLPIQVTPLAAPIRVTITVNPGAIACVWQANPPIVGSYVNAPHRIVFTNQQVNLVSAPNPLCAGGVQLFSATYAPLIDSSKPAPNNYVWVN